MLRVLTIYVTKAQKVPFLKQKHEFLLKLQTSKIPKRLIMNSLSNHLNTGIFSTEFQLS